MSIEKTIHERIDGEIRKSGLPLEEISEKTGLTVHRLRHLCKDRLPKGREILALAVLFNVRADYLLGME